MAPKLTDKKPIKKTEEVNADELSKNPAVRAKQEANIAKKKLQQQDKREQEAHSDSVGAEGLLKKGGETKKRFLDRGKKLGKLVKDAEDFEGDAQGLADFTAQLRQQYAPQGGQGQAPANPPRGAAASRASLQASAAPTIAQRPVAARGRVPAASAPRSTDNLSQQELAAKGVEAAQRALDALRETPEHIALDEARRKGAGGHPSEVEEKMPGQRKNRTRRQEERKKRGSGALLRTSSHIGSSRTPYREPKVEGQSVASSSLVTVKLHTAPAEPNSDEYKKAEQIVDEIDRLLNKHMHKPHIEAEALKKTFEKIAGIVDPNETHQEVAVEKGMKSVDIKYLAFKDGQGSEGKERFSFIPNSGIVFSLKHGVSRMLNFFKMKEASKAVRNSIKDENIAKLNQVELAVVDMLDDRISSLDGKVKATVKDIITKRQEKPERGR